jgi:hypothetical protein
LLTGTTWYKRRRTGPASQASDQQEEEENAENVLKASRHWERREEDKTEGCMAEGLRCNLWARAQSPETVSLTLTKGWTRLSYATRGNLGMTLEDLRWTAATSELPQPPMLKDHPILRNLPNKLVHFILD